MLAVLSWDYIDIKYYFLQVDQNQKKKISLDYDDDIKKWKSIKKKDYINIWFEPIWHHNHIWCNSCKALIPC